MPRGGPIPSTCRHPISSGGQIRRRAYAERRVPWRRWPGPRPAPRRPGGRSAQTARTVTEPRVTIRSSAPTSWMATRTDGPAGPGAEHPAAGLDRAHLDRAQVVEHGVGGRHPGRAGRRRRVGDGRPAGRLVGQHGHRAAVEDPPRVPEPVVQLEPGDRTARPARCRRTPRVPPDRPGCGGMARTNGRSNSSVHGPGVEDGARHGGGGHVPVVRPLVDHVEGGHHRGPAAPEDVGPEPQRARRGRARTRWPAATW